jgi:DNA-binding NarL/FixJ family response regulator
MRDNGRIKVLCVDDNEFVGEALQIKLALAGGFEWLGRLADASSLVHEAQRMCPHVVLLDIDMPGPDPFEVLKELTRVCPNVRAIMFTGHLRPALFDRAVEAGAWGYLTKSEGTRSLLWAIEQVAEGQFVMGADVEAEMSRGG